MHRDPEVYPELQVFRPERWIVDTEEELQKLRSAFFPLSLSTRACIGKKEGPFLKFTREVN
jgi:cytochrome P450